MKRDELRRVDLVAQVAGRLGLPKELVANVVTTTLEEIGVALGQGKKVRLAGFGIFEVRAYPARMGVHPRTGEPLSYPERQAPTFRAGLGLKRQVRNGTRPAGDDQPAASPPRATPGEK